MGKGGRGEKKRGRKEGSKGGKRQRGREGRKEGGDGRKEKEGRREDIPSTEGHIQSKKSITRTVKGSEEGTLPSSAVHCSAHNKHGLGLN